MEDRKHDIEKYLKGEMTAAEMHALEKAALDDPFLAEALEGLEHAGGPDHFLHDLHKLNKSLHERTHKRRDRTLWLWGWHTGIAAAVLLVAVSGFLVISILRDQQRQELAMQEMPPELVLPSGKDSLTVILPPEAIAEVSVRSTPPVGGKPRAGLRQRQPPQRAEPSSQSSQIASTLEDAEEKTKPEEEPLPSEVSDLSDSGSLAIAEATVPDPEAVETPAAVEEEGVAKKNERRAAGVRADETSRASRRANEESHLVSGRVTSATDGDGLPGVNVTLKGTSIGAVTDENGNYQLSVPEGNAALVFSFIGFQTHEVALPAATGLNVALEEDATSLSEVVVVSGYGSTGTVNDNPDAYRPAQPQGGKARYKDYLSKAVEYPAEAREKGIDGRVVVRFTVEPDGTLTQFEVVRGIGSGCDEALIRAIQNGPRWDAGRNGDTLVKERVKVRYKFGE